MAMTQWETEEQSYQDLRPVAQSLAKQCKLLVQQALQRLHQPTTEQARHKHNKKIGVMLVNRADLDWEQEAWVTLLECLDVVKARQVLMQRIMEYLEKTPLTVQFANEDSYYDVENMSIKLNYPLRALEAVRSIRPSVEDAAITRVRLSKVARTLYSANACKAKGLGYTTTIEHPDGGYMVVRNLDELNRLKEDW